MDFYSRCISVAAAANKMCSDASVSSAATVSAIQTGLLSLGVMMLARLRSASVSGPKYRQLLKLSPIVSAVAAGVAVDRKSDDAIAGLERSVLDSIRTVLSYRRLRSTSSWRDSLFTLLPSAFGHLVGGFSFAWQQPDSGPVTAVSGNATSAAATAVPAFSHVDFTSAYLLSLLLHSELLPELADTSLFTLMCQHVASTAPNQSNFLGSLNHALVLLCATGHFIQAGTMLQYVQHVPAGLRSLNAGMQSLHQYFGQFAVPAAATVIPPQTVTVSASASTKVITQPPAADEQDSEFVWSDDGWNNDISAGSNAPASGTSSTAASASSTSAAVASATTGATSVVPASIPAPQSSSASEIDLEAMRAVLSMWNASNAKS